MSDQGGDPACWLDRVCPECGAFLTDDEDEETHVCRGAQAENSASLPPD